MNRGFTRYLRQLMLPLALALLSATSAAPAAEEVVVYKSPWCGCCQKWVEHMQANGFTVTVHETEAMDRIKDHLGVPAPLRSCHTAEVGGYVIEGHVPARDVQRLLRERPAADGLAVAGMPVGSPGMEQGKRRDAYAVELFEDGRRSVFARY